MNLALAESTQEKVPPLLEDMLKRTLIVENPTLHINQTDIFLVLIIVLLLEHGFFLMADDTMESQCLQLIDNTHLSKWKNPTGVYEFRFVLGGFNDTLIKLVFCPIGTSTLINVVISDINPEVYSVCFPVSRYVVDPQASTIPKMFHDLKHLSDTFKNKVITPVKGKILNHYGYSSASLLGLPEELIFSILLYLPVSDIINVAKMCKKLSLLLNNESFWHKLFLRDFSNSVSTDCQEWKILYRNMYTMHQESLHRARSLRGTLHDLMDVSDYMSYIDNPMWDIII